MSSAVVAAAVQAWPAHGGPALAIGGVGFGRGLAHFFIFRLIFRAALSIWRVPVAGPFIDIVLGLVIVTLLVLRAQLGPGWWRRRFGSPGRGRRNGTNAGPRGW